MESSKSEQTPIPRKLSTEEVQNAQIGLLEWEIETLGVDQLTGLRTRKFFENELDQSLKTIREKVEEQRSGIEPLREASLIFIDLDKFKEVNDTFGHLAGDDVLKKVAEILVNSVRKSDVVARFGGDEFYILLPRASQEDAEVVADKIRTVLGDNAKLKSLGITASIGVSSVNESNSVDSKTLIERADAAMYADKQGKLKLNRDV